MAKINKVCEVALNNLVPYQNNAKIHDKTQIAKIADSIQEFGFISPCLIDENNNVIAGHGRIMAAHSIGMQTVPCVYVEGLSDVQRRAYILADNKLTELGGWNMEIVKTELADLDDMNFDISLTGFDFSFNDEDANCEEDNFVVEDVHEPKVRPGDIYLLGKHRLMCGDSTSAEDVELLMCGDIADIEITSPPYNVGSNASLNGNNEMPDCKYVHSDDLTDYDALLRQTTDNALLFSRWAFINLQMLANNKKEIIEWLNDYRNVFCDVAIWNKGYGAPAMAERVMNSAFEFVFCLSNENQSRAIGTREFRGTVPNIFDCPPQRKNEYSNLHSATYPMDFPKYFIENFTNQGDAVLDLFGGTGTTMIACEQLNRKCYMMEIEPIYCDIIIHRWEEYTGEKAVLL